MKKLVLSAGLATLAGCDVGPAVAEGREYSQLEVDIWRAGIVASVELYNQGYKFGIDACRPDKKEAVDQAIEQTRQMLGEGSVFIPMFDQGVTFGKEDCMGEGEYGLQDEPQVSPVK